MKKQITILSIAAIILMLLNSYTNGAPGNGVTGSIGDKSMTCAQSYCHGGTAITTANMITTDIPTTGWEAGKTYSISFKISEPGVNKFGFQVTSEDAKGNKTGTFVKTAATKLLNGASHITHIFNSTAGTGTKTWTFSWVAPSSGTGSVTFYGAGNATNGDGTTSGDKIMKSSLSVSENSGTTGVYVNSFKTNVNAYPNPVLTKLFITGVTQGSYKVYDLSGLTHITGEFENGDNQIDMSALKNGVYFIRSENDQAVLRILKR